MDLFTPLAPGEIFAREYRVVRPLAEGGMGAVYLAEQASTGKRRALKVMQPSLVTNAKSRERFALEARIGAKISSAHVVEVVGAGVDESTGAPWLAMELLDGEDLAAMARRRGALNPSETVALMEQACHALGSAHRVGIVHCDLKPENLFVARPAQAGVAYVLKVLDFGIARMAQEGRARVTVTTAMGSPLWMAPEQGQSGAHVSPATDVWALGLIAFYLLTGRYYWRASNVPDERFNVMAQLVETMTGALDPPSARALELGGTAPPLAFDAWFARCVAREPEHRFADATLAFEALRTALAVDAPPASSVDARARIESAATLALPASPPTQEPALELAVAPTRRPEMPPPAVQKLRVERLSEEERARLRALGVRARREGTLIASDNLGGELAPAFVGFAALVVNTGLAISQGNHLRILYAALGSSPFFLATWLLMRRRLRRSVGTFLQPTAAYFVAADGADAALYSWASLRGVELVERRLNGVYIGTDVALDFGGMPLTLAARDMSEAVRFRSRYETHGHEARAAVERGAWRSLEGADLLDRGANETA